MAFGHVSNASVSKFMDTKSLERLANASTKNRAEYTQLTTQLGRLEKEKQNELRMSNNEIQRFKARYSRTSFTSETSEASNVKMYETHNPGFCYRRNGEHRLQQVVEETPSVDFEHLHFLLFTDGEVDIEKILCLHLLSSHETEHLTPPRRPKISNTFMKKDSPLEQLIERSNDNPKEPILTAILPTYVIDVHKGNPRRSNFDERLAARLLINEKLWELIMTVVTALENSNPGKVQQLLSLASDASSLKRIFRQQHIQDFVMTLKDHSIVNSCSSFILTQPKKIKAQHIEIRTASGALEDLVLFIRSNVLQFPSRSSFNILQAESKELVSIQNTPPEKLQESEPASSSRFRRSKTNFVQKNIVSVKEHRRNSEDDAEEEQTKKRKSSTESSNDSKSEIRAKRLSSSKNVTIKQQEDDAVKVHLKQTTCPACMEKWKIPLPSPKVSMLVRKGPESKERVAPVPVIKTNSRQRLSTLIEKEQYTLDSYDRKYSNLSNTSNLSPKNKKINQSSSLDLVALDVLDLERIRQEIREKETKKKLEKFLTD